MLGKTPYVRFDKNDYSVPHDTRSRTLTVLADLDRVRILEGTEEVARHGRSFDQGQQIEDPRHIEALVESKRHARKDRAVDALSQVAPSSRELLTRLAARNKPIGRASAQLLELLRTYGPKKLEAAICEALDKDAPHPQAVRHILEREREAEGRVAALPLVLPDDPRLEGLDFAPPSLSDYDAFLEDADEEEVNDE